jgi:hypothetical protein
MSIYKAPLTDIRFALYDVLDAETLFAKLGYDEATRDLLDAVLEEAGRFTETVLAPLNGVGDEVGCRFDKASGDVTTPPGFREAYAQFGDNWDPTVWEDQSFYFNQVLPWIKGQ